MTTTADRVTRFLADKPTMMHIAVNGVWGARLENGASVSSYEKLDYHAGCREFLQGIKDAGIPFTVHGDIGREFAS